MNLKTYNSNTIWNWNYYSIIDKLVSVILLLLFLSYAFPMHKVGIKALAYLLSFPVVLFTYYRFILKRKILLLSNTALISIFIINYTFIGNVDFAFLYRFLFVDQVIALYLVFRIRRVCYLSKIIPIIIMSIVMNAYMKSIDGYILFEGMGRNYVSILFLFSLFIYVVLGKTNYKDINFLIPMFFIVISIFSIGRSGIITAILFTMLCIWFEYKNLYKNNIESLIKKVTIVFSIVFCGGFIFYNQDYVLTNYFSRFLDDGPGVISSNYERLLCITTYIDCMMENLFQLIFGVNLNGIYIFEYLDYNLHNSILMLHKSLGVFGVCAFFYCIKKTWSILLKNEDHMLFIIMISMCFRSIFDNCFPYHILNIPMLYFCYSGITIIKGKRLL